MGVRRRALAKPLIRRVEVLRVLFGAVWAIDAYLKWEPSFVSGYADTQVDESEKAGVLGFIHKPYCERDLIQAVRTALDAPPPQPSGERPRESRP